MYSYMKHSVSWDEIIEEKANQPLASGSPPVSTEHGIYSMPTMGGLYEITLHPPQTDSFLRMTTTLQKKYLSKLWQATLSAIDPCLIDSSNMIYEFTKTGQVHSHGFVKLTHYCNIYPIGGVSDLVKCYLNVLPKKKYYAYRNFDPKCFSKKYCRYESPSICVTYRYADEHEDHERWFKYMAKAQC